MKILRACGTPDRQVKAIEVNYTDTKAKVLSPNGQTELFDIFAGVLQGDNREPYLFITPLE